MRKIIIVSLISILLLLSLAYFGKGLILRRIKSSVIESVEKSTSKGLAIEGIGYIPLKGLHLENVTLYKDRSYGEKEFYVPSIYIKFPVFALLVEKKFSPVIIIDDFKSEKFELNGAFGFSVRLPLKTGNIEALLETVQEIEFAKLSLKTPVLDVQDIEGAVKITRESIRTLGTNFVLNGAPCKLNLEVTDPAGDMSAKIKISSPRINVISEIKKEKEIYKISELRGVFLNSSFNFVGEFSFPDAAKAGHPALSVYGEIDLDTKDALRFAPPGLKNFANSLNIEGKITNSLYAKCNLDDISSGEFGVKSSADYIKVWALKVDKFYADMRAKDRVINVPIINAYPYGGVLSASAQMDLNGKLMPYQFDCKLSDIDIAKVIKNTPLDGRNISGLLFADCAVKGNARDIGSMQGAGKIAIQKANLGPAPLLTPLLGNLYGYLQNIMPELKQVDITNGSCNFYITQEKVATEDLVLWGEVMSINAKGYVDFNKNLNFQVENKFVEPKIAKGEATLGSNVQNLVIAFGKMIGKAYLTGTLEDPKWKFVYLGGMENLLKGGVDQLLKGILKQ